MSIAFQVTLDARSPLRLGQFWAVALGYRQEDPPPGFASWDEALRAGGVPEENWDDAYAVVDPDGSRPRLWFQKVPEDKTAKNRVHLDVSVGAGQPPEERWPLVLQHVEVLSAAGATQVEERSDPFGGHWMVMTDPEGNEFCVQ